MPISTHILDTTRGKPAAGVHVHLEVFHSDTWRACGGGTTNADGRIASVSTDALIAATYRLRFLVEAYLEASHGGGFYPEVSITFAVKNPMEHFHVPLLLNPYGFSTYRGS